MSTADAELSALQHSIATQLRSRSALRKSADATALADTHLTGNDRLDPVATLEIYREQFWLRHTDIMLEDFPGLSGIIGQADWERLVETYFERTPPESWTLRDLGAHFPEHVQTATWLEHHALCSDMARLEWCYVEIFDAADRPPLDAGRLAAIPEAAWETARIILNPALRLLEVGYPVADLRRTLRDDPAHAVAIPAAAPQWLALYRGGNRNLYHRRLEPLAFDVLRELARGTPLVRSCELVTRGEASRESALEASLAQWFQSWAELRFIVDVIV